MVKIYVDTVANYKPWSGAISTYDTIVEENKLDELDFLLEELYPEGISESHLNDILWFDSDWVFAQLGINDLVGGRNDFQVSYRPSRDEFVTRVQFVGKKELQEFII